MNQHWAVQPLALIVLIFCVGFAQLDRIVTPDFCKNASSPQVIVKTAKLAGICLPVNTAQILSILTSWELHTLRPLTDKLPKPIEMVENRIEIGKISAGLAAIGTPECDLMMEAIEDYDSQAKETIQSLSELSYMSTLVHNTLVGSLTGIIDSLNGFPRGEKRAPVLQAMIRSRQDAINAWAKGLTDTLKVFHGQTAKTLANLDGSDASLKQIIRTSGRTKGQQQGNVDSNAQDWGSTLFGAAGYEHVQPAALGAVPRLEALIRESSIAREVIGRLSIDVAKLMTGIEAANRYPDQMSTVEMTLEKEVELMVDMLRKVLGGKTEPEALPRVTKDDPDPQE